MYKEIHIKMHRERHSLYTYIHTYIYAYLPQRKKVLSGILQSSEYVKYLVKQTSMAVCGSKAEEQDNVVRKWLGVIFNVKLWVQKQE